MFIPYEKIGNIIYKYYKSEKLKNFFYSKKVAQNLRFIKKNKTKVLQKLKLKSKNGEKIKIVFYVYDETKWKCQSIYDLLKKEPNFEVKILVTKNAAQNIDNPSYQTDEEIIKTYDFFKKHNMNVEYAYDFKTHKHIPLKKFKPDIIIYQHPWYVETSQGPVICSKFALTYYIPYNIANVATYIEYGLRFHQYIEKYYVLNDYVKNFYHEKQIQKTNNMLAVGHPQLDYYLNCNIKPRKYVIYSPHWTIKGEGIGYSTFLENGELILEFAQKHPELNWVFKPHPLLFNRLCEFENWGKEKTQKYYDDWKKLGIYCDNCDYMDLFNESVALITDCGSFLTEYLLTEQPVIHLVSANAAEYNDNVKKIVKTYYQSHNNEELKKFLDKILIQKEDCKKINRINILKELNLANNNCAQNILNDIKNEIK